MGFDDDLKHRTIIFVGKVQQIEVIDSFLASNLQSQLVMFQVTNRSMHQKIVKNQSHALHQGIKNKMALNYDMALLVF